MSDDPKACIKCEGPKSLTGYQCASCSNIAERLKQAFKKEIADKHVPKVIRPTQEPLYEKRG